MYALYILGALAASFALTSVGAAPHQKRNGIDPGLGGPVSPLNRQNPNYTKDQLNDLKLAYTQIEKISLLQSYGDTDDYFKFDFTSEGSDSNAGRGEGGYGK